MLCEVLHRSFSGDVGLQEEAEHGEHGEPSILDLLHLEQRGLVWVVREPQWIKWTSGVELVFQILQESDRVGVDVCDK